MGNNCRSRRWDSLETPTPFQESTPPQNTTTPNPVKNYSDIEKVFLNSNDGKPNNKILHLEPVKPTKNIIEENKFDTKGFQEKKTTNPNFSSK